jgi:GNAT superfamily N-acetyltransferase
MEPGLSCRDATAADYPHFQRLFPELAVDDPTPTAERWVAEIAPSSLLLERAGEIVAYAYAQRFDPERAHLSHLVVAPAARGQGLGRTILLAMAARLRAEGRVRWSLNVKVENAPARRLYEALGLSVAYPSTSLRLAWGRVASLPREPLALATRPIAEHEDAALEDRFDLTRGRITFARAQPGRVLLRLVDPGRPDDLALGFAVFDPAFPGVYPIQLARPTLAPPLLEALRQHAREGDDDVIVGTENAPDLARALVAAGAEVRMEILHMRGALPEP